MSVNEDPVEGPMMTMPDEVLETVFSQLEVEDLRQVRLVCRRWRQVAWRFLILAIEEESVGLLESAPCCRRIEVYSGPLPKINITCPTSSLLFVLYNPVSWEAVRFLRKQQEFGLLTELDVFEDDFYEEDRGPKRALLGEVLCTAVESLGFHCPLKPLRFTSGGYAWMEASVRAPTIKQLRYCAPPGASGEDEVLNFVLRMHSATLQVVELQAAPNPGYVGMSAATLLARCPLLWHLTCPLLFNIDALKLCPSLRSVTLLIDGSPITLAPAFLLSLWAARLERLTIVGGDNLYQFGCQLLAQLAASGEPELTELRLYRNRVDTVAWEDDRWSRLMQVPLQRFPRLAFLDLRESGPVAGEAPPSTFLKRLSAATTVPSLRVLHLDCTVRCSVRDHLLAISVQDVLALLTRCPRLHIQGLRLKCTISREHGCWLLALGVSVTDEGQVVPVNLFRHAVQEPCDLHRGTGRWLQA